MKKYFAEVMGDDHMLGFRGAANFERVASHILNLQHIPARKQNSSGPLILTWPALGQVYNRVR